MNMLMLTASGFISRLAAISFQAWLAGRLGASGIGLYQLTGTVTVLFSAVAVSGIRFAATRLVSEESGLLHGDGVQAALRQCTSYALFFGLISGSSLFLAAEPLGFLWIGDARAVQSLKIAALGMPVIALSSVLTGYMTASGNVWKAAVIQLIEQAVSVCLTVFFLRICNFNDMNAVCSAITGGAVAGGYIGLLIMAPICLSDCRKQFRTGGKPQHLTRRLLSIALPLAFSSYTKTALSTIEHLLIPRGLRLSGLTADAALSGYGLVHGMALPAVLFPACLLYAMAELLVPELTEAQMRGQTQRVRSVIKRVRRSVVLYAAATGFALLLFAKPISVYIFHTPKAERYILLLAPLVPVMNLDTVTDACLRGLGQQKRVMQINILDAAIGVALVLVLLPNQGINGYVEMIWLTECGNMLLSSIALRSTLKSEKSSDKSAGGFRGLYEKQNNQALLSFADFAALRVSGKSRGSTRL